MSNRYARLTLVLATLVALRALVGIGYMLQMPASADFAGVGFSLCPTQNAMLDLSALESGTSSTAHHDHTQHGVVELDGPATVDVSSGCGAWVNSLGLALNQAYIPLIEYRLTTAPAATLQRNSAYRAARNRPPVRAPPSFA